MNDVLKILNEISSTPKKNLKIEILKRYHHFKILKKVLVATYDPNITYYIKKIPEYTASGDHDLRWAMDRLIKLSDRTYTGHDGIEWLKKTLEGVSYTTAIVIERIIKRDLRCGFSASTINKVWTDLIPKYKLMLAYPRKGHVFTYPQMAEVKSDGMRCNVFVSGDEINFISRSGKPLKMYDHMKKEFSMMVAGPDYDNGDWVFDGELMVMKNGELLDRKTGNGILNKAVKNTITKEEVKDVVMVLWDAVPLADFNAGICRIEASTRYHYVICGTAHIDYVYENEARPHSPLFATENWIINSEEELDALFEKVIQEGKEGLIVKNPNGFWKNKKSKDWIKMKLEKDIELVVTGWEYGKAGTKYEKMMGALIVENRDGTLKVSIGGGWSDHDRETITKSCIGEIITVKYNTRITSKSSDIESLYLPRFEEFRYDKDEADL